MYITRSLLEVHLAGFIYPNADASVYDTAVSNDWKKNWKRYESIELLFKVTYTLVFVQKSCWKSSAQVVLVTLLIRIWHFLLR